MNGREAKRAKERLKMYGRTILFDHGKRAEITSEHQEWTDALAHLIAAAPEMLALLKEYLDTIGQAERLAAIDSKARALLARIEGDIQ